MSFSVLKQVWITIVVLATLGVVVTGAIITFSILAVTMGTGQFSLASSLLDLFKQALVGIVAGGALGYLAALLIAHQRWSFLAEYAPVVTLATVIGAYFAADGLQASGFMAVFVCGIMLGNRDSFGFAMRPGEQKNSRTMWRPRRSSCAYSSSSCSAPRSISCSKAPDAQTIASITFIAILMTILIQRRPPSGWHAGWACWKITTPDGGGVGHRNARPVR